MTRWDCVRPAASIGDHRYAAGIKLFRSTGLATDCRSASRCGKTAYRVTSRPGVDSADRRAGSVDAQLCNTWKQFRDRPGKNLVDRLVFCCDVRAARLALFAIVARIIVGRSQRRAVGVAPGVRHNGVGTIAGGCRRGIRINCRRRGIHHGAGSSRSRPMVWSARRSRRAVNEGAITMADVLSNPRPPTSSATTGHRPGSFGPKASRARRRSR